MNKVKRNAVILIAMLFVCTAIYLNWSYGQNETSDVLGSDVSNTETEQTDSENVSADEYFASVRLNRQQARSEASQTLETVSTTEGVPQETLDAAASQMLKISQWTVKEAEIESMIVAKGFTDCVMFMTDEKVTVTVAKPEGGLTTEGAAQIRDIITSETDYTVDSLTIIEV